MRTDRCTKEEFLLYMIQDHKIYERTKEILLIAIQEKRFWRNVRRYGASGSPNWCNLALNKDKEINGKFCFEDKDRDYVFNEIVSHYSQEVFNIYVPPEMVREFMDKGYALKVNPVQEDIPKRKFKVGDKVEVISVGSAPDRTGGKIGIIEEIDDIYNPPIKVFFGSIEDYWFYEESGLKLVAEQGIPALSDLDQPSVQPLAQPPIQPKEINMNPNDIIKTHTTVFGNEAETRSDDQLFADISVVESEIEKLSKVVNKPQKLKDRIKEMLDQLDVLVKFIDER